MKGLLRRTWTRLYDQTVGTRDFWYLALQNLVYYRCLTPILARHVRGRTLDLGAGKLAWRGPLRLYCDTYLSADVAREHPDLDYVFDLTGPVPLEADSVDTIFCNSVLEHVQDPAVGLSQIYGILKPDGKVLLSVPFLFYLHGQPHDYYRFTPAGIAMLCRRAGFEIVESTCVGGYASNLLNAPSLVTSVLLALAGLRRAIPWATRAWTAMGTLLDRVLDPQQLFASNAVVVLRKPRAASAAAPSQGKAA